MGHARNNSDSPDWPPGEETPQQQLGVGRPAFGLDDGESYTPQMYMADLERLRESGDGALKSSADQSSFLCHPLHAAVRSGRSDIVQFMLDKGWDRDTLGGCGGTPLQEAFRTHQMAVAQALLAAGADVNHRCHKDVSALDLAAREGQVDFARAIIEHGGDVNAASSFGITALHFAASEGRVGVIDVLVEAGASIDQPENFGRTPLHYAAVRSDNRRAVHLLLKHGAGVHLQDEHGETPLHVAAARAGAIGTAEVVDLLLRQGADENVRDSNGRTAADLVRFDVEEDTLAEDVERVRSLLANAPADRAWRRRGFLAMCRAHYPSGRVQLGRGSCRADASIAKGTRSNEGQSRTDVDWAGVASMLMGAGSDPISLMGDGADLIFQMIVGFL